MVDLLIAEAFAFLFSGLLAFIELLFRSKTTLRSCLTGTAFLYFIILLIGNTATTIFAAAILSSYFVDVPAAITTPAPQDSAKTDGKPKSAEGSPKSSDPASVPKPVHMPFPWFWYAFVGIFGFEALLKNMNVTFVGQGVLSINDWISKARDLAVAAAIEEQAQYAVELGIQLDACTLTDAQLDTLILNALGAPRLAAVIAAATAAAVNVRLAKCLAFASEARRHAEAALP